MITELLQVYRTDNQGGMAFWEKARALRCDQYMLRDLLYSPMMRRSQGVFEEPFMFDYLEQRMRDAPSEEQRCVFHVEGHHMCSTDAHQGRAVTDPDKIEQPVVASACAF